MPCFLPLGQGRDRMGDNGVVPPGDNGHQDQHQVSTNNVVLCQKGG